MSRNYILCSTVLITISCFAPTFAAVTRHPGTADTIHIVYNTATSTAYVMTSICLPPVYIWKYLTSTNAVVRIIHVPSATNKLVHMSVQNINGLWGPVWGHA